MTSLGLSDFHWDQRPECAQGVFLLMFITGGLGGTLCNSLVRQEQGSTQAAANRYRITCQRPFIALLVSIQALHKCTVPRRGAALTCVQLPLLQGWPWPAACPPPCLGDGGAGSAATGGCSKDDLQPPHYPVPHLLCLGGAASLLGKWDEGG